MAETPLELDTVLDVCEHPHRRAVLAALAENHQSISVNALATAIVEHDQDRLVTDDSGETLTQIRVGLHHAHLPKLDEAGLIEYNSERQLVKPTARLDEGEPHLMAVLGADSELAMPLEI